MTVSFLNEIGMFTYFVGFVNFFCIVMLIAAMLLGPEMTNFLTTSSSNTPNDQFSIPKQSSDNNRLNAKTQEDLPTRTQYCIFHIGYLVIIGVVYIIFTQLNERTLLK